MPRVVFRRAWLVTFPAVLLLPALPAQQAGRIPHPFSHSQGDSGQVVPEGSSPFDAPLGTDTVFVVDEGPGLDTGCTFRSGGPLLFDILVTRYVGDVQALVAAGAMEPNARLRMPAFDVDFDAVVTGGFPERDEVWFNGPLVPEVYLTGADGVWKLNAFTVPVDWINFATPNPGGPPTPGVNTVEIRIDVANAASGQELWCTAWPSATTSGTTSGCRASSRSVCPSTPAWTCPSWTPLSTTVRRCSSTSSSSGSSGGSRRWWWSPTARGGVDARMALFSDSVSQLIQIGAPNLGSRLADFIQAKSLKLRGIVSDAILNAMGTRAGLEMTTRVMSTVNGALPAPPGVKLTSVAGDYDVACPPAGSICRPLGQALLAITGPGDGAVHMASAHGLAGAEQRTWSSAGTDKSATHRQQPFSAGIFNLVQDLLLVDFSTSGPAAGSQPSTWQPGASHADVMTQGGAATFTLEVGSTDPALFVLLYPSADQQPDNDLDMTLMSPSGKTWDAAAAAGAAGVGWEEDEIPGGWAEVFQFDTAAAEAGTWTVTVDGTAVVDPSGQVGFAVGVLVDAPAFTLATAISPEAVRTGQDVVVTATVLDSGSPVAGDGVYSGQFTATGAPADFAGTFSDACEDTNGNGFFDWLVLTVGLDIAMAGNPGRISPVASGSSGVVRYRLVGELTDSASNTIATLTEADLGPLATGLELRFDGRQLYRNGVDGPYTVSCLALYEVDGGDVRLVAELANPHTTQAYTFDQFEHTPIALTGAGSDTAIDDDGNGKFDRLEIAVEVRVENADFYEWTARLVDQAGVEIAFVAGSGNFKQGVNDLTFSVPGTDIGAPGVDGPYVLRDLLIFSGSASLVAGEIWRTAAYSASDFEGFVPPPPPPGGGGGTGTFGTVEGCRCGPTPVRMPGPSWRFWAPWRASAGSPGAGPDPALVTTLPAGGAGRQRLAGTGHAC